MSVLTLPAKTYPDEVTRVLYGLTDGMTEVVAVEVLDHPLAVRVSNGAPWGGDGGPTTLGAWLLGPSEEVWGLVRAQGWELAQEIDGAGHPLEEES